MLLQLHFSRLSSSSRHTWQIFPGRYKWNFLSFFKVFFSIGSLIYIMLSSPFHTWIFFKSLNVIKGLNKRHKIYNVIKFQPISNFYANTWLKIFWKFFILIRYKDVSKAAIKIIILNWFTWLSFIYLSNDSYRNNIFKFTTQWGKHHCSTQVECNFLTSKKLSFNVIKNITSF